jgi:hypothetical protein
MSLLLQVLLLLLLLLQVLLLLLLLLSATCTHTTDALVFLSFLSPGSYSLSVSIGSIPLSLPQPLLNIVALPSFWSARCA